MNIIKTFAAALAEIATLSTLTPDLAAFRAVLRTISTLVRGYAYAIEDGCVENLDYETHARGKNWIATVVPSRAAPGGLERTFWRHGSGRWYKAPSITAGDVIEMAGDYYTGRGSKKTDRRYVLVVRVDADHFVGTFISDTAPSQLKIANARKALAA